MDTVITGPNVVEKDIVLIVGALRIFQKFNEGFVGERNVEGKG